MKEEWEQSSLGSPENQELFEISPSKLKNLRLMKQISKQKTNNNNKTKQKCIGKKSPVILWTQCNYNEHFRVCPSSLYSMHIMCHSVI